MIIAVDAGCLGVSDDRLKVGVYNFVLNLLENLSKLDKNNKYLLYSFNPIPTDILGKLGQNWSNLVLRPKKGWLNIRLPVEFLKTKPDIFLGLGQALPLFHPFKSIVFVYDLAYELFPEFYPDSHKRLSRQTKFAARDSDKIVAVSNSTKNDLVKIYDVKPDKISVIYPGVSIGSSTQGESLRNTPGVSLSLTDPYFLFVGSYKPNKNIPNIIKAFSLFRDFSLRSKNKHLIQYQLIIAGSDYWMDENIIETIKELKLDKLVKLNGFASGNDLKKLYKVAAAFISPSFYEGFGIPILEAMASGIPVITSNRGSIPEVVGNAALVVDPTNTKGLKDAMVSVATNNNLREQMIQKGLERSKQFDWQKSARELLKLLR